MHETRARWALLILLVGLAIPLQWEAPEAKPPAPSAIAVTRAALPISKASAVPPRATRSRAPHVHRTPNAGPSKGKGRPRVGFSALELRISWCESKHDYRAENPTSTASGRWQVIDGTWARYAGYRHASSAPPWIQDRWARAYFDKNGYRAWNASRRCWGR